ncbi:hypothetical protein ACFSQD_10380 [Flavihumibacter stibioxidans]|uniref:MFS transporter n=1 Tax=Flavihumibacter stibioxidans TaxID=1834163 RepID=A0ABR7MAA6_9BACT|nr:hypothetical protein [Flavihumibacter stibioxidans]MBC6491974.1 hypothetical protein [Flavihumibacter stibioxidans]
MTNQPTSPFRDMQVLYRRLLYAQIVFGIIAFLLVQFNIIVPPADVPLDRLLQVIAVLYSFAAVIVGIQLFRRRLETIRDGKEHAREKLGRYRGASLVQWSLLESASIFCTICYLITGNWAFLGLTLTILVIFGGLNPFKHKVMIQLRLSDQDVAGI